MRHNSKDTSKSALMRGSGSLGGLAGAARSVWAAAADPDDDTGEHKLFGIVKSNYARKPMAWRYRVVSAVPPGEVWVGHSVSKVEWTGPSGLSIDDVLAEEDHDMARDAATVLTDYLESQGGSAPSVLVKAHMKSKGFGSASFKAAKKRAGAVSSRIGFTGGWTISLPQGVEEVGADPFQGVAADPLDPLGEDVQGVGAPYRPTPWTPSTTWTPSKESKETKESKERVPPAGAPAREGPAEDPIGVIASADQTITCRDYRAHQGEAHVRTPDGWTCTICSPDGAGA